MAKSVQDNVQRYLASGSKRSPRLIKKLGNLQILLDKVSRGESKINGIKVIERIYEAVDLFMAEAVNPYITCKQGCSHCCKVKVDITGLEATYIQARTGKPITSGTSSVSRNSDCPFLKNNKCSIYEYRPITCRMYGSFDDPKECEDPTNPHKLHSFSGNPYWFQTVGQFLDLGSRSILADGKECTERYKDIRDWFQEPSIFVKNIY